MKNNRPSLPSRAADALQQLRLERWTALAAASAFIVGLAAILLTTEFRSLGLPSPEAWAAGRTADKDYIVERDFPYVDESATEARRDAQARLVPPVFELAPLAGLGARDDLDRFSQILVRNAGQGASEASVFASIQEGFSDRISRADLRVLLSTRSLPRTIQHARELLDSTLSWGVVDMIAHADEASAAGSIELRRMQDGRLQSEMIPMRDVVTRDNAAAQAEARLLPAGTTEAERRAMRVLVGAFATENAFFDADATRQHGSAHVPRLLR